MEWAALPHIDTHTAVVGAGPDAVWRAIGNVLDGSFPGGARYARLVGCADRTASGPRPPAVGSTFPGFRVTTASPGGDLVLSGRHRFSAYALIFRLEADGPGRTRVSAETRAVFPGWAGRLYRLLVIGTGAHAAGMRRLLRTIGRRAG
ncbi:hypothetical protein [Streptomyces diastatochromogenes]|uniref:DUF2867 domain-containing protein n=1 Tax=Streptomyces diastatochromogenes TaxID=42236 RepID=A0A233S4E8_STRDA|nr:hypothetical protein [Streptomyces diastatochromogenes]OXY90489.1 hypothetical protein BEK98_34155 [Streptomyces diastatochromogenes]